MSQFNPEESLARIRHEFGEHGGVNMSVEASTTFTVMEASAMPEIFQGGRGPEKGGCYLYGRHFNPTVYVLGRQLAAIENTEFAYCTASGLSAIACTILQLCDAGDRIVSSNTIYGGTFALLNEFLSVKSGLSVSFVDIEDLESVEKEMAKGAKVLYAETIGNPTLSVANIPELSKITKRYNATLVIDNTFAPVIISPAVFGADVVVHSLTKFINGASDIIAGAICGSKDFIASLMDLHTGSLMLLGPSMDPTVAFSISTRIPHLPLRMKEHSHRTLAIAERLAEANLSVIYPGLETHSGHDLLKSMLNDEEYGYGGIFGLDLGTKDKAFALMELLQNKYQFGYMAVSLGYFDTLMSCSAASTSSELTEEEQKNANISPGLIRISIGYSGSLEQRWKQLSDALRELCIIG